MLQVRLNNLTNALAVSRKAEQLEPHRAGYHLLSGKILLKQGKDAQAADAAKYVADRWSGPDQDEAVELWTGVAESQRPSLELSVQEVNAPQTVEGKVKSTTCGDDAHPMILTLESQGKSLSFRSRSSHIVGFSDTLWYGSDHFSTCHHLEGLRAVVHYKGSDDKQFEGDIASVEYREDLPHPIEPKTNPAQATPATSPR